MGYLYNLLRFANAQEPTMPSPPGALPADYGSEPWRLEADQGRRFNLGDPDVAALWQKMQPRGTPPPGAAMRDWGGTGLLPEAAPQGATPPPGEIVAPMRDWGGTGLLPEAAPSGVGDWAPAFLGSQRPPPDGGYTPFLPPQTAEQGPSPVLPQPQGAAQPQAQGTVGGFWGGLLDLLKNVPLQGGGRYSKWSLPSYNEMTAGRRTLDWARAQGLDVGPVGSVSPKEAQFRVEQAAKRRLDDPMGMNLAQQLIPPEAGEPPERMMQRAWIARLPHSALPTLVAHQVQQYGLPGWGDEKLIDPYAALKGLRDENAPAPTTPAPTSATPAPGSAAPSGAPQAPAPAARDFDAQFNTILSPQEESQFQQWKAQYAPRDSGEDYDLRGAFKAGLTPDPTSGHWPDTFKKPNHETFSTESRYAAYGRPGTWQGEKFIKPPAAPSSAPLATRQPGAQPVPPEPAATAPPAAPVAPTPAPTPSPQPGPGVAPAAPSTAAMPAPVAPPSTQGAPGMPQVPTPPTGDVTQQQVLRHPTVTAAQAAYDASRTLQEKRQNAIALRNALANAPAKIQQEQHQRYTEQTQAYRNVMEAQKFYQEAARAPYGYGTDLDAQIRMDYHSPAPGDPRLPEMAQASEPRLAARLAAEAAQKAAGTMSATEQAKFQAEYDQPLWHTRKDEVGRYRNPQTAKTIDQRTKTGVAEEQAAQGQVAKLNTKEQGQFLDSVNDRVVPVVDKMLWYVDKLYGPGGKFANLSPSERANVAKNGWEQFIQNDPLVQEARGYFKQNKILLTRLIEEGRGNVAARLTDSVEGALPQLEAAFSFDFKPPFVHFNMPDTRGVALRRMRSITDLVDQTAGSMMNNPQFHYPWSVRWTFPEDQPGVRPGRTELMPAMPPGYKNVSPLQPQQSPFNQPRPGQPQPPAPAFPGAPMAQPEPSPRAQTAMPNEQRAVQAVYKDMNITAPPHAGREPQAFGQFLTAVRTKLGALRPGTPAAQLDQAVANLGRVLAQQQGVTWPPPR
jgi:hypothetical protein